MKALRSTAPIEKFVFEKITSIGISLLSGAVLTLIFASNPVGWVAAIGLGVGAAYGSAKIGKEAAQWYSKSGEK